MCTCSRCGATTCTDTRLDSLWASTKAVTDKPIEINKNVVITQVSLIYTSSNLFTAANKHVFTLMMLLLLSYVKCEV